MASFIQDERRNTIGDTLFLGFAIPDSAGKNALSIFPEAIRISLRGFHS
jgi:hypothetical protein